MADYSRLVNMFAAHGEAALFRRFDGLNLRNILYMQAELVHLEAELHHIERQDRSSSDPTQAAHPLSVYDLKELASAGKSAQWSKHQEIQMKLQAYNHALLQYASVRKFFKPSAQCVELLRDWLDRPEGGDFFLKGREADIWNAKEDLISLDGEIVGRDALNWLISEKLVQWYHRRWGYRTKPSSSTDWYGIWQYDKDKLNTAANAISLILASLLPSTSIMILYLLSKPVTRLVTIMFFSLVFSLILSAVSTARRIEIFAATTALAAVQVVFVSAPGLCTS